MARSRRRRSRGGSDDVAMPSITSLMDIITIILVYLIKTFATSPVSVQDPSVSLPLSNSLESVEETVVVMITGAFRREAGPDGEKVLIPDTPTIVVDDDVILHLSEQFEVPKASMESQYVIRPLKQKLLETKKMQNVTAELTEGDESSKTVVFVVDKEVTYDTLTLAMVTASKAGFPEMKFAIVKKNG